MRLYNRLIRCTVKGKGGSVVFYGTQSPRTGLQIQFNTTLTLGSKQNSGTVTVTNLSKDRRNKLGEEYDELQLEVGYGRDERNYFTILKGDIRDVGHDKSSPDVESTIEVGDGDKAIEKGKVSKTFPTGTKPKDIVEYLRNNLPGVSKGPIKGLDDLPKTKRPVTVYGRTYRELDEQGRQHKFYWGIQHGQFQAVKYDEHLGGVVRISQETGMVGIAEPTDKGVKFKSLIIPGLIPGRLVDVYSDFLDEGSGRDKRASDDGGGLFRLASVNLSGASRSDEFYAACETNRVQGDKVQK